MNKHNIIAGISILVVGLTIGTWYGSNYGFSLPFRDNALQSSAAMEGGTSYARYCKSNNLGPYISVFMTETNILVTCRDGSLTINRRSGTIQLN